MTVCPPSTNASHRTPSKDALGNYVRSVDEMQTDDLRTLGLIKVALNGVHDRDAQLVYGVGFCENSVN
jgi:hypothetical protein